ncbi:PD40 domain-containing protein [Microbacteriaceae bacterium VKM Ac-2855]|nr:PD40 domain-containing protein [Microbacteriaceae bacterium VKM Ac-2855]
MPTCERLHLTVALVTVLTLAACSSSEAPTTSDAPTTSETTAGLPLEPRTLLEWYPNGANHKTIYVSDAAAADAAVQIVPDSAGNSVHASWSHDGEEIVWEVLSDNDTATVWTAHADGSDPRQEVACAEDPCVEMSWPAFSPDGTRILSTRYDREPGGDWGPSHLVVTDRGTGDQTILASTNDGATAFYSSSWSPDGSHIAAQLETYPDATESEITGSSIVVTDADPATTVPPTRITDAALFAGYPRWHPTEDRILFASWDLNAFQGDEASQLYTVTPDGFELTQITHINTADGIRPGEASWTPDGTRIITALGTVSRQEVVTVTIGFVDPATGDIDATNQSGAMPSLQPARR